MQIGQTRAALDESNLPAHAHETANGTSSTTGGGQSYSNMQPSLALDFEIVTEGVYPSEGGGGGAAADQTMGFVQVDAANDNDVPPFYGSNGDL